MLVTILVMAFLLLKHLKADTVIQHHFTEIHGYYIEGGNILDSIQREEMSTVRCASKCRTNCGLAVYSHENKACKTFTNRIHQSDFNLREKPGCVVIYKNDAVTTEGWTLVFRGQAGIGRPVIDYWSNTGKQDDNPRSLTLPAADCWSFNKPSSCDRHVRSYILDTWDNIDEVRYSLYADGKEVNYIVFNGTKTTRDSWFQQNRILCTSWSGIKRTAPADHFTLVWKEASTWRSFYIFGPHNGCSTDVALTFIIEKLNDPCQTFWSTQSIPFPIFMHSMQNTYSKVEKEDFGFADAVAVFVKFKDPFGNVKSGSCK